ncbi:hypothetical protein H7J06_02080 [Mycobacterium hodleri]|uniref:hypothetical protein n=1 Tax=Mycolicibacterium hodleri TaxID=49897 RepID=UPI0021F2AB07|nr:hypothetical protein [Mycolicibacterium hodleri]MCV7131762.1 hypothetical protein [Mycolicibacterium hodleri]
MVAPVGLAGGGYGGGFFGSAALSSSVADNFVALWHSGDRAMPAGMNDLVQYWRRYHVAKAVLAGLLVVVLAAWATRLWKSSTDSAIATRRQRVAGAAGATVTAAGFGAALLLMANVQGAVAPLSSVLTLLPPAVDDPAVGQARAQVSQQLRAHGTPRPVLAHMINDFGNYHAVLAASAVVLACATVAVGDVVGRSFVTTARSDRAARRKKALASTVFAMVGIGVLVLAAANVGNAADPARALLLFYAG